MHRKPHSTSLVLLLVCIFAFWWGISAFSRGVTTGNSVTVSSNTAGKPIVVTETTEGSIHTYNGVYVPQGACEQLGSGIRYSAQNGGEVTILLSTIQGAVDCAQADEGEGGIPFSVSTNQPGEPRFVGILLNNVEVPSQLTH